ncbi:MAG: hypothetical protein GX241_01865 [Ruminococcaceae bacterium]|nr:hypothetical protein [Oscillospiraceae bacterium]
MNRIGIVDRDLNFLERFRKMMADDFEVLWFPNINKAQTAAATVQLKALLINEDEGLVNNIEIIPTQCKVVYICESIAQAEAHIGAAVCKYQSKAEWHKFFAKLCIEDNDFLKDEVVVNYSQKVKMCVFTAGAGGVGASTAAAAFCVFMARQNKKSIFINTDYIFIKKTFLKDEGILSFNKNGVSGEEIMLFCDKIAKEENPDLFVFDIKPDNNEIIVLPIINASKLILVSDGREISNLKTLKLYSKLKKACEENVLEFNLKTVLLYNRFSIASAPISEIKMPIGRLGGINEKSMLKSENELIEEILKTDVAPFYRLMENLNV